jgi:Protein of unknown function (DUF3108)
MPVLPARSSQATAPPEAERPSRRALGWLVGAVLALHLALILGLTGTLDWRLSTADAVRVAPMQTRWVPPATVTAPVSATAPVTASAPPRTRIATEPRREPPAKPQPEPTPAPDTLAEPPPVEATAAPTEGLTTPPLSPPPPATNEEAAATGLNTPADVTPPNTQSTSAQNATPAPTPATPTTPTTPPSTTAPDTASASSALASVSLPPIPVGALPPPVLLSYRMTGQEKGLTYHANGELRWQHNEAAYALSLSVKAFLIGSRHWRSQGEITSTGLTPTRFSDSWRSERAAHFDRANQRVVFSSNAPVAALEPGAQDQISLYVQLAAAMAGAPQRFQPGTRLQVQTVTLRDALPWLLTLEQPETLELNGQAVPTAKWVCQPRNRFDAKVEFWVASAYAWMPVRIRITQVSGSFIDLVLRGQEALPPLPMVPPAG